MLKLALRVLAWLSLAAVAVVTLSPVGVRPHFAETSPLAEDFAAFAAIGLLFGLAYPRRLLLIAAFVGCAVVSLELAQMLTPDRHGRLADGISKVLGAVAGAGLSALAARLLPPEKPNETSPRTGQ
ncbi:MAG: hypothetical protein ABL866_07535 [Devosia sp.]